MKPRTFPKATFLSVLVRYRDLGMEVNERFSPPIGYQHPTALNFTSPEHILLFSLRHMVLFLPDSAAVPPAKLRPPRMCDFNFQVPHTYL